MNTDSIHGRTRFLVALLFVSLFRSATAADAQGGAPGAMAEPSSAGLVEAQSASNSRMTAADIVKRISELTSIENSNVSLEMRVFRDKTLSKEYRIKLLYRDSRHSLSETLYPPKSKGEIMLHSGENDWLFLPRINRVIRVSLSDSFSNSDFSNLDVMNTDFSKDYIPKIVGAEKQEGEDAYRMEFDAKTDSSTYAKIVMWVRQRDFFVSKREYYTYSGHKIKEMSLYNKNNIMNGMPDTFVMTSDLEAGKYTVLNYVKVTRNQKFADDLFHESSLVKR